VSSGVLSAFPQVQTPNSNAGHNAGFERTSQDANNLIFLEVIYFRPYGW